MLAIGCKYHNQLDLRLDPLTELENTKMPTMLKQIADKYEPRSAKTPRRPCWSTQPDLRG